MKWEYKAVNIESIPNIGDPVKLQGELNKYGEEGWELVGLLQKPQTGVGWVPKTDIDSLVFKRLVNTK